MDNTIGEPTMATMINNLPGFIYRCANDPNWTMIYISEGCQQITGYTPEDFIDNKTLAFNDIIHPDYQQHLWDTWQKLLAKKGVLEEEYSIITASGEIRWVWERGRGIFSEDEELLFLEGFITDITDRKRIEEALKESEEKFRTFFEESPMGIEIYDAAGVQTAANRASFNMFGIQDDSSSSFNLFDGTSLNDELKQRLHNGNPVLYEASFDFNRVRELNQYHTTRSGIAAMEYLITPLKSEDSSTIQGYILQVQDITERKHSEQLQKVLYNISNAVATTQDLEELIGKIQVELGTLVDTTNFYVALYDERTGMLSTPFYKDELDEMSAWPADKSATGYVIKTRKSLLAREEDWESFYKSGEIEEVGVPSSSWLGVPLFMDGKATGALVVQSYDNPDAYTQKDVEMLEFVSHQISLSIQRKKAEQDLLEAMEKAQESDTLKSAFLANMSHEIRTPMNAILGFTELLGQADSTPEEHERFTGIIRNAGKKLMRLIDDIIDISKLEVRQITISPSACDVVKLLITTVESYNAMDLLKKKPGVSLRLKMPPAFSIPEVQTDPLRLQQVLDNLVTNAIKFTDMGFIEIGVRTISFNKIAYLEFHVTDTGKGIPPEKLGIIFERFRQVEVDKYRQGAGLGLSISKALVELMGGEMRVVSEEGKGTTFYFTIPFRPVLSGEKSTMQPAPVEFLVLSRNVIYIAEDEDDGFDYIALLLKDTGAILYRADNGDLLMKMIHERIPDLLLLDINMPGKTGYDCLQEIRDSGYPIKIIAQTAYAMVEEKRRCIEAGCHGYLAKPFSKKGLIESIVNVLKTN